jgi:hypothetical protein
MTRLRVRFAGFQVARKVTNRSAAGSDDLLDAVRTRATAQEEEVNRLRARFAELQGCKQGHHPLCRGPGRPYRCSREW